MPITLTGHHIEITDGLRAAVNSKLTKLQKNFPDMTSARVILTVEKNQQIAEINSLYMGQDLTARACASDLYLAISEMACKLTRVLKRHKEKIKAHPHVKPLPLEAEQAVAAH